MGFLRRHTYSLAFLIGHFMNRGRWELSTRPDGMTMAFLTMSMRRYSTVLQHAYPQVDIYAQKQNIFLWGAMIALWRFTVLVIYVPFFRAGIRVYAHKREEYSSRWRLRFVR
jgi:Ca2+-transporting ATPase